jgi:hypothetical protein
VNQYQPSKWMQIGIIVMHQQLHFHIIKPVDWSVTNDMWQFHHVWCIKYTLSINLYVYKYTHAFFRYWTHKAYSI